MRRALSRPAGLPGVSRPAEEIAGLPEGHVASMFMDGNTAVTQTMSCAGGPFVPPVRVRTMSPGDVLGATA
ncbi:MAG: hypothetical protein ACK559_38165, partial [bacterium]